MPSRWLALVVPLFGPIRLRKTRGQRGGACFELVSACPCRCRAILTSGSSSVDDDALQSGKRIVVRTHGPKDPSSVQSCMLRITVVVEIARPQQVPPLSDSMPRDDFLNDQALRSGSPGQGGAGGRRGDYLDAGLPRPQWSFGIHRQIHRSGVQGIVAAPYF